MKKAFFLLAFTFHLTLSAQTPTPPPLGCMVFTVFDSDNDGLTQFNLDAYALQFRAEMLTYGFDLSGYAFEFYPSENDYQQGTNLITISPYTNIIAYEQFCFLKYIYSGTGPLYGVNELDYPFACHKLETTFALATNMFAASPSGMHPNPSTGIVKFNTDVDEIALNTLDGKTIRVAFNNNQIDLSGLPNGIYMVTGKNKSGRTFSEKIVKN